MDKEDVKHIQEQQDIEKKNNEIIRQVIDKLSTTISAEEYYELIKNIKERRNEIYKVKIGLGKNLSNAYLEKKGKKLTELEGWGDDGVNLSVSTVPIVSSCDGMQWLHIRSVGLKIYPIHVVAKLLGQCNTDTIGRPFFDRQKNLKGVRMDEYALDFSPEMVINMVSVKGYDNSITGISQESGYGDREGVKIQLKRQQIENYVKARSIYTYDIRTESNKNKLKQEKETINRVNLLIINDIMQYYDEELEFWKDRSLALLMEEDMEEDNELILE